MMNKLKTNNINLFGARGERWIKNIPKITEYLAQKWQLTKIVPVDNMSWNYVAKVYSNTHGFVCIKISINETLIDDEIKALKYFDGHGMIKLIDHDTEFHALLLQQAIPGKSLKELYLSNQGDAIIIYNNVVRNLLSALKPYFTTYKHVRDWLQVFDRIPENALPKHLIHKAKLLSNQMLTQANDEFVLHGDLHMDNVISDHKGWIAIDPKGIIGPKEFEVACFDFITQDELSSSYDIRALFDARILKLSQLLEIDHSTLKNWVFIRLILGACWMIEDNGQADTFLKQVQIMFPNWCH